MSAVPSVPVVYNLKSALLSTAGVFASHYCFEVYIALGGGGGGGEDLVILRNL